MNWVLNKLREQSTWKGIAVLVGIAGYSISPELLDKILMLVGAFWGIVDIVRKEKNNAGNQIEDK